MKINTQRFYSVLFTLALLFISQFGNAGEPGGEILINDDHKLIIINKPYSSYHINFEGKITLSKDDKSVLSISPGGFLEISRASFGNTRKIEITSDKHGNLSSKYYEGRSEADFDPDGKKWLADILPLVVRQTGIGAESRIARIYSNKGINGLINEVDEINSESSSVRNLYFVIMVDQIGFNDDELKSLIPELRTIESNSTKGTLLREILYKYRLSSNLQRELLETTRTLDYNTERGSVLRVLNPDLIEDEDVIDAYFDIIDEMSINSEKGNVLKHLLSVKKIRNETYMPFFESVSRFSSEREKGSVLLYTTKFLPEDKRVIDKFNEVVNNMSSPYYILKGEILNTLLKARSESTTEIKNKQIVLNLLNTAADYESNSQKALTLRNVNRSFIHDREILDAYFRVLYSVSSELEAYNILLDLIRKNELTESVYKDILDYVEELISRDYQHAAGAVLRECIGKMPYTDDLLGAFFSALQEMDQNSTIEEILRLLLSETRLQGNDYVLTQSIESLDRMSVDIEKKVILLRARPFVLKQKGESLYAYKSIAKEMESEYLRRTVLEGL
ncbi:MAG: hypothetical protein JW723_05360 [Bacteroidales bacterium]|nr:hypothetical protein [Bacteroidales bacterium]